MKFSLSAFLALAAVMPVIASVPLKIPMALTIVTDWDDGTVTVKGEPSIDISMPGDQISIDVEGSPKTYRLVTEIPFDNVDPDHKVRVDMSTFRKGEDTSSMASIDVSVVADPGVKFVHMIIENDLHPRINVYDKEVKVDHNPCYTRDCAE